MKRKLYMLQNGKCNRYKDSIYPGQLVKVDHIVTKKKDGRSNNFKNLRLVHGYCHD